MLWQLYANFLSSFNILNEFLNEVSSYAKESVVTALKLSENVLSRQSQNGLQNTTSDKSQNILQRLKNFWIIKIQYILFVFL